MTLNILFLTLTIKRRILDTKDYLNRESLKQMEDANRDRLVTFQRVY